MSNTMLIDAAPILEALNKRYRELYGICRNAVMHIRDGARLSQLEEVMELIQKAPVITSGQPMEATWREIGADKRGRGGIFRCTACDGCHPHTSKHCPNCGAKMAGGDGSMTILSLSKERRVATSCKDDLISRESLVKLIDKGVVPELLMAGKYEGAGVMSGLSQVLEITSFLPNIDAEQVVRCKECKHCAGPMPLREDRHVCVYWNHLTDPNGYCHMGVKRDAAESD